MAENEDDEVLETEKVNDEEGSDSEGESKAGSFISKVTSKVKNLSTSMLIYIAGGLAVLIIALAAYLFFASEDEPVEEELSTETIEEELAAESEGLVEEAEPEAAKTMAEALGEISSGVTNPEASATDGAADEEGITIPDLAPLAEPEMASKEEETIELPPIPDMVDVSGAVTAMPDVMEPMTSEAEQALPLSEEDRKLELFKLREQALLLEEENRRLKQRLSSVEGQDGVKSAPSKPREREPELPKPTWGDFAPVYRGH